MRAIVLAVKPALRRDWRDKIAKAWSLSAASAVAGFIETGRMLAKAKGDLAHGEFLKMIEGELPFDRTTAFRLMAVAGNPILSNVAHAQHLPASWYMLYQLSKVPEPILVKAIKAEQVTPEMKRKAVRALLPSSPQKKRATLPQDGRSDAGEGQGDGAELPTRPSLMKPATRLYFEIEGRLRESVEGFSADDREELFAFLRVLIDGLEKECSQ